MILTVTLNPSLDRALDIGTLRHGKVNRAGQARLDPGGKGVNVSRALVAHGIATRAVLPYGGHSGAQLVEMLDAEGVGVVAVPIGGRTRSNLTLVEPSGLVTKINEPGPELTAEEFEAVCAAITRAAEGAEWVVLSGAAPPGVSIDEFTALCRRLAGTARLAVDAGGPWLLAAARAGAHLVKPNRRELSETTRTALESTEDVARAAIALRAKGVGAVLASLAADGAVLVDDDGVLVGTSPQVEARSNVGAGDAMLAGFLAAGAHGDDALIEALSWGAAAVSLPGSRMPAPGDVNRTGVRIRPVPTPQLSTLE
ncbi:MAG TPA: 1-phosphofructokinase family hexose kinase [Stackebrandtia sp.]|jgi:1-phosphofructokinase|uniref:1-phosphofructokinase family hexose kinase n=1 Tax=Stackebrandtia sp. TaxID=2023065 RepID=UPI002D262CEC|nr:1-phosphofructokinase family hexose kinase [Stackebrandtia sp.]HZE37967.1 1-phosphofructokinase family hexose kinase [Stackebrandtia sp.]